MAESALSIRRDDLTSAAPAPHDTPVQYGIDYESSDMF